MIERTLQGQLTTNHSGAVCWEVYAATYDLIGPVAEYLRTVHGFAAPSPPVDGLDSVVATIGRPGLKLSVGWDIWSGFYVFGSGAAADALVRQLAADLEPRLAEPEFQACLQEW